MPQTPELLEQMEQVRAYVMPVVTEVAPANQNTTAAYVDLAGSKIDARQYRTISYTILNAGGANGLTWKVLASNDDVTYIEVQAPANVAFGASSKFTDTAPAYRYYKIQVIDQVGGNHTAVTVRGIAKS